jgi:hypothetical protein
LFQLRVEHEVRQSRSEHGWNVVDREHPWINADSGEQGFIDLILEKELMSLVVECKRVRDGQWVFPIPTGRRGDRTDATCLAAQVAPLGKPESYWPNYEVEPASPGAEFCAIRGSGEDQPAMLERMAWRLLDSMDAVARERLKLEERAGERWPIPRLWFPLVVTTAELVVCEASLSEISLDEGMLTGGGFTEVASVRFHKSLATTTPKGSSARDLAASARERERTVFIVRATELKGFLGRWAVL